MVTISQGKDNLRSYSRKSCPLPQAMSLPSAVGITKIDLDNLEQLTRLKFCTALQDHTRYVSAEYLRDLCKNEGVRSGTKIQAHILAPPPPAVAAVAAVASMLSKTYTLSDKVNIGTFLN